jgi:hypothetical protein
MEDLMSTPINPEVKHRTQVICAWCGPVMTLGFFIGLMLCAHFIPPPSPAASADQIAAMFRNNTSGIRIGLFISMLATGLLCPFYSAITIQMRRIEGHWSALSVTQAVAGACSTLEIVLPMMIWQAAAFRPERDPVTTQALNDMAWLPFLGLTTTVIIQNVVLGIVILADHRAQPLLPRWYGYLNFFAGMGIVPAGFIVFFKTGPLAWDGIIAWWLPVAVFFCWIILTAVLLTQSAGRTRDETLENGPSGSFETVRA